MDTKSCEKCGKSFVPGKPWGKFCSAACREQISQARRRSVAIACPWCGKERLFTQSDANRGRSYCSKTCAKRDQSPEVRMSELPEGFGHWLAGFTDGEGHFQLKGRDHTGCVFSLGLREDDRPVLEYIRSVLGFGKLYREERGENHGLVKYQCNSIRECVLIVALFREFPLRSKKAKDFEIWARAVTAMRTGERDPEVIADFKSALVDIRRFIPPPV